MRKALALPDHDLACMQGDKLPRDTPIRLHCCPAATARMSCRKITRMGLSQQLLPAACRKGTVEQTGSRGASWKPRSQQRPGGQ